MNLQFQQFSEILSRPVQWLWTDRIPLGAITMLDGDPGTGKSTLAEYLVTQVSTGNPLFGSQAAPISASVLMLQGEDTGEITRMNLEAAGANLSRVYRGGMNDIGIPGDIPQLANYVEEVNIRLIIVDPLDAFFDGSMNNNQAVRAVLGPLALLAEQQHLAIVIVRHLNQRTGGHLLYRGIGSIAIIAAARTGLMIVPNPLEQGQSLLLQYKTNYGQRTTTLAFRVGQNGSARTLEWLGESELSADDLRLFQSENIASTLEEAIFVLFSILGEGELPASQTKILCRRAGVSDRTLKRAKAALGVQSRRRGFGPGSQFFWRLPDRHVLVASLREREMENLVGMLIGDDDDPRSGADEPGTPTAELSVEPVLPRRFRRLDFGS